jgi:hypothetical protein
MRIAEKLEHTSWCSSALQPLKEELDRLLKTSIRIPSEPGGWWHQYVCPEHHTELLFDPFEDNAHKFLCPHGCVIEGEEYRGAWLVFKHQSLARYALQAAAVYAATKESKYAELASLIIGKYAEQFPKYPVHEGAQAWMLKGRAFHQALTEAIWSTTLIRAYLLLKDEGSSLGEAQGHFDHFLAMLEKSMGEYRHILIYEKKHPESNYTAWLNASLACVYAAQNRVEPFEVLLNSEGGLQHHLTIGVMPDQLEFEGSTYYHVFVLRAYMITAEMAVRFGIDAASMNGDKGQSLKGMFDVLAELATDLGELPALHDGPYKRIPYALEIAEVMEAGYALYRSPAYLPIIAEAYRQMGGERVRCELEAVLYGEGDADLALPVAGRQSLLLPDSGFAILRQKANPLSVLSDFGAHGGSHGHYDKLHISIEHTAASIAPDMGMVPYGSSMRKKWFAETSSHNTVAVGGRSQAEHRGSCMAADLSEEKSFLWLRSDKAYEGCLLDRRLLLTDEWLLDWFDVQLQEANQIDAFIHSLFPFHAANSSLAWDAHTEALGQDAGYSFLQPKEELASNVENIVFQLNADQHAEVFVSILLPAGTKLIAGTAPGTSMDPSEPSHMLVQRVSGCAARFINVYSTGKPVSLSFDNDQLTIRKGQQSSCVKLQESKLVISELTDKV